jgi:hypothetical protein
LSPPALAHDFSISSDRAHLAGGCAIHPTAAVAGFAASFLSSGMAYRIVLRIRVGDYRIIYRVNDDALEVRIIDIGHRREVYCGL